MQTREIRSANILPEADIRSQALNGGDLVPKSGLKSEIKVASTRLQQLIIDLLFTANHIDVNGAHKMSACNLLCTVISQCCQSSSAKLRNLVWDRQTWSCTLELYLVQNHALSVKPLRQLLTTLTTALDKCDDPSASRPVREATLQKLVGSLCNSTDGVPIRPAMQTLTHFIIKKIFSMMDVHKVICETRATQSFRNATGIEIETVMDVILQWAPYSDYSSSAALLASAVLENVTSPDAKSNQAAAVFHSQQHAPWTDPILKVLAQDVSLLDNYRHYVFPELFKHNLQAFVAFLERLNLHETLGGSVAPIEHASSNSLAFSRDDAENILFSALSVGNKIGLVQVSESSQSSGASTPSISPDALCIPDVVLGSLLSRASSKVRIAGLSLLIASTATTKTLSLGTMEALKAGLPSLHADPDAGFRSEMVGLIRNLIDRLRGASSNLMKMSTRHGSVHKKHTDDGDSKVPVPQPTILLEAHQSFLLWYLSFLKMELRPSASYQRHSTALKCIVLLRRSGVDSTTPPHNLAKGASTWPFKITIVDEAMSDLLLDLLLDSFEDIRQGAAEILSISSGSVKSAHTLSEQSEMPRLVRVLHKAERMMMSTGRADHAEGVAHLYNTVFSHCLNVHTANGVWWESRYGVLEHLVCVIENTLNIVMNDINAAVREHPLHGVFTSVRYIMETPGFYDTVDSTSGVSALSSIHIRLQTSFHTVWSCVKAALCRDAAEGEAPEEMDDEDDVGATDALSYSWRALKEASLLMRTLVKNCPLSSSENSLMTSDQLRAMGDLAFTQLAELRHRGAFSAVSQTFTICCVRCNTGSGATRSTLEDWYQRAVLCIQNQTAINTRRSAGLPSLMVGILIADETKGDLYQRAVRDLTTEAIRPVDETIKQAGGLSQVHALNCLKDMFKASRLGDRSEAHIPDALSLAAKCLSSKSWAIRNSGLMLFRALLDRLLGTNESYINPETAPQSRTSLVSVPSLMDVVYSLVSSSLDEMTSSSTEGVFPALQLLQRSPPPANQVQKYQDAVLRLTTSSQWHIRDKAARTYATLFLSSQKFTQAALLIDNSYDSLNAVHGALLAARYMLQGAWTNAGQHDLAKIGSTLNAAAKPLYHDDKCPFTKAAFVDLYADWCYASHRLGFKSDNSESHFTAATELSHVLYSERADFAAHSALRQSLAHATIQEFACSSNPQSFTSLSALAKKDPDACASALFEAAKLCDGNNKYCQRTDELLLKLCAELLFDSNSIIDHEVQAAAQDVLLVLLNSEQSGDVQAVLRKEVETLHLPANAATPLFQDKRLILQGALLELRFDGAEVLNRSLPGDVADWVIAVKSALHDDNPFDTRIAAAQAVARIEKGLTAMATSSGYNTAFLDLCLAVYDLTNDDDDEIRNLAATAACRIFQTGSSGPMSDLIPIPAGSGLAEYTASRFPESTQLAASALLRACDVDFLTKSTTAKSVGNILAESNTQNTTLFTHEKPNLYIDEAREACLWSQILTQLSPSVLPPGVVQALAVWTTEGLETLRSKLDREADGPLGWKRRSEVFVLGLRVIYAAEVLTWLVDQGADVGVSVDDVRGMLEKLLEEGRAVGMHPLWAVEIETVLKK